MIEIPEETPSSMGTLISSETLPVDPRLKLSKKITKWFFGISIALMLISIFSSFNNATPSTNAVEDFFANTQPDEIIVPENTSWAPTGFTVWDADSNIAYKWAKKNNCDYYGCISAEFISRDGCPNGLYAALNWLDANDSVTSYDNATLPSLQAGQIAKLRFDDVEGSSKTGQMAEINCR